ncbi:hypothetical protein BGZ94_004264 [Podila epigama]|nr:hypothetical protein BGZ94_004264 [Podila epigama]
MATSSGKIAQAKAQLLAHQQQHQPQPIVQPRQSPTTIKASFTDRQKSNNTLKSPTTPKKVFAVPTTTVTPVSAPVSAPANASSTSIATSSSNITPGVFEPLAITVASKSKEEMLQSSPSDTPIQSPTRTNIVSRPASQGRASGIVPQKFHWKHGGEVVIVTGTFDDWKQTVLLKKVPSTRDEFMAVVDLDRTKPIVRHDGDFG